MLSAKHKKYFKNQDVFYTCNNKQRGGLQETCTSYDHVIIESYLKHTFPLKSSRIFRAEQLSRVYIIQKRKKRLSDILFGGSLFSAFIKIMYRSFPIRAYADRENTALLPTERIRQKQRCRKRFSAACGIKSFNSLS